MSLPPIASLLEFIPLWVVVSGMVVGAVVMGYGAFEILRYVFRRVTLIKYPFVHNLISRTSGVLRFAVILGFVSFVSSFLPLDDELGETLNRTFAAAVIVLLGWVAIAASDIALDRYLRRFRIDTEDNLLARRAVTQLRVLKKTIHVLIVLITAGLALMTFETVRQFGVSLFASAGVAGLAVGLAARPLLSNLIAGIQIALTQPIRIDDAVVVENEWGWIEELTSTYVVIRLWDWRRLIVPLGYFLEHPFQNWTRTTASLIGTVIFYLDHSAPIAPLRNKLEQLVRESKSWDGQVVSLQVTDTSERTIVVRAIASARNSSSAFDLRCEIREKMLEFLQAEFPKALPRSRGDAASNAVS